MVAGQSDGGGTVQRITMTLSDDFLEALDSYMQQSGYTNRSEAVRDLMRFGLQNATANRDAQGTAAGVLSYVYDHGVRELARRLMLAQHEHHDLSIVTTHVHMDHDTCLEVVLLRGPAAALRRFSEQILAERGVRHGHLHMVAVEAEQAGHSHGGDPHPHFHLKVRDGF